MAKGKRMRGGRKTETLTSQKKAPKQLTVNSRPWSARNLSKKELAGVIFACKSSTFEECMSKLLFGLPGAHFAYVQNVTPGMPLFLYNCSNRKIFGIFEAATSGQMNLDKKAWTAELALDTTPFPAQVRVKIQMLCKPLVEAQYKPVLVENYGRPEEPHYFWYELDQNQTRKLKSLLSASPDRRGSKPSSPGKWGTLLEKSVAAIRQEACSSTVTNCQMLPGSSCTGKEVAEDQGDSSSYTQGKTWSSLFKAQDPLSEEGAEDSDTESLCTMSEDEPLSLTEAACVNEASLGISQITFVAEAPPSVVSETTSSSEDLSPEMSSGMNSEICAIFDKLLQTVGEIREIQITQTQKIESLDLKLAEVNSRLQKLECHHEKSGSSSSSFSEDCCDSILLVGGFDGSSWLQDLMSYLPSEDLIQPLVPMNSVRPNACAVELNGEIFVLGGGGYGGSWYDTVESYNLRQRQWVTCPALIKKKGSLAGACLLGNIFAVGGGNEAGCLSEVEVLDLNVGKWMVNSSMLYKRLCAAATELNGMLYVAGGYDGYEYLSSVERYDPRAYSWQRLKSMNSRRGCHSLTVLNDKLYAIGGYDGTQMVPTVEVFEPRTGSWTMSESMTYARGYMGTVTFQEKIYAIGGMQENNDILDTVDCYSEAEGWKLAQLKSMGRRCFFSAVAV